MSARQKIIIHAFGTYRIRTRRHDNVPGYDFALRRRNLVPAIFKNFQTFDRIVLNNTGPGILRQFCNSHG